jgi:hypothetical protein
MSCRTSDIFFQHQPLYQDNEEDTLMMDNEENTDVNNMQGHTRPIQTIKPQINVFGNGGTKLNNFVSSQAPS